MVLVEDSSCAVHRGQSLDLGANRASCVNAALGSVDSITPEEAWSLLEGSSYTDLLAPYLLPMIEEAVTDSGDPRLAEANRILQDWDLQSRDESGDGDYDGAATAIFRVVPADVDGDIGYFFGGHYPERVEGHDNRFPVSGDGGMDWVGRLPVDEANPNVLNPRSGFIANWNNKPGQGVIHIHIDRRFLGGDTRNGL